MRGSATLAIVASSACMIEATMTEIVISTRCCRIAGVMSACRIYGVGCAAALPPRDANRPRRAWLRVDRHVGAQSRAQRQLAGASVTARRTGSRCTTFTQLPVAFSAGSMENAAPVPGLKLVIRAWNTLPG